VDAIDIIDNIEDQRN